MIYLDNAATSFPKPPSVTAEQTRCMREYCGNPGRGSHELALRAAEKIYECREEAASLFGSNHPENTVFTMNTTIALNMAIKGLLRRGDHVLLSDMEHNAVFRPIYRLAKNGEISYDIFPTHVLDTAAKAEIICHEIEKRITPRTRMLICAHSSNICSSSLPLKEIGALCRRNRLFFVVDAAQSAGHHSIDMQQMAISALCVPGHKGLFGPQGSGILLFGEGIKAETLFEGGSGYQSLEGNMPEEAPERYEAGTLPTPAISGLCEGIRTVKKLGTERIFQHEKLLNAYLQERLLALPKITVYTPHLIGSVLLFNVNGISADQVGNELNENGICVRAGYHCAALGHATLGTPTGGAVRVSPGIYNTFSHMDALVDAVKRIIQ